MTRRLLAFLCITSLVGFVTVFAAEPKPLYVKKGTRADTIQATLKASGYPDFSGKWHWTGPFDNTDDAGFDTKYPPEKKVDLDAKYVGKGKKEIGWTELKSFPYGTIFNLATLIKPTQDTCVYLYTEIESDDVHLFPLMLGSDDSIVVFLNGQRILSEQVARPAAANQNRTELKLKPGRNELLIKVCNIGGDFAVYVQPEFPKSMPPMVAKQLDRDYPSSGGGTPSATVDTSAESKHYRITTLNQPTDCVLEVGGMGMRPDGKLVACTRRGEVWIVTNPGSDDPAQVRFTRFATGLHESLGLWVQDDRTVFVTQRAELTKLIDTNGDDVADEYQTFCDKWGVSGDYHEFAFGPARDKDGNFFITLNVGFGGGHQAKGYWRGWCVKIDPKGDIEPWATGLRSPNGVSFSPDGDLFYCDNQGEWVATNKMHHIQKGENYGHEAGLRWVKDSPFKESLPSKALQGMRYDGEKRTEPNAPANAPVGFPNFTPPCIWFPYGRMGNSASEPRWDTSGGKFGPFTGQCFVGDQTKSMVMRVALEKVDGRYQGACFPFRSGFQCGINRLLFDNDGNLYAGQTNRGWGSLGGKPYGLQRLSYTGVLPFEVLSMNLTKTGFQLTFTKPVNKDTADKIAAYSMKSFTYVYTSNYGYPETDTKVEKIENVKVSADGKSVTFDVPGLHRGRVFDLHIDGVKDTDGSPLLHADAYYTLNHLVK